MKITTKVTTQGVALWALPKRLATNFQIKRGTDATSSRSDARDIESVELAARRAATARILFCRLSLCQTKTPADGSSAAVERAFDKGGLGAKNAE